MHDGARALVVDPPRDLGPLERAAEDAGVDIAAVADTHVHSDYVSGAQTLAARHRVPYLLSAEERVEVDRLAVHGGDVVPVGALEVQVLGTPGHTLHHQSYVVRHGDLERPALFSGGSLLHGTVGRTDLVDPLLARLLGRAQWQSAQHQAVLPAATTLHPTHGYGSLCSSTPEVPGEGTGTVGHERRTNPALTIPRDAYVEALVDGFGPVPSYYRHLARLNRKDAGARRPGAPVAADVDEVADRARRGEWVIDVRPRAAYAAAHLPGSVSVELGDSFATWAGWVTPRPGRRSTPRPSWSVHGGWGGLLRGAGQPPATAGITEIWVPSGVGVFRLSRKRTSSLPTYTLTNRRSWPASSRMRPLMPA